MSHSDAINAPFVAIFHYGRELFLSRLLSWWVWAAMIIVIWRRNFGRIFFAVCALTLSGSLMYQEVVLMLVWSRGLTSGSFVGDVGAISCMIGVIASASIWSVLVNKTARSRVNFNAEEDRYRRGLAR